MQAIRTTDSNFTFLGPAPDIADLPGRRGSGRFTAVFALTDSEREMIANGAQIELGIWSDPIPPVSIAVARHEEAPGLEHDGVPVEPDYRCEQCQGLYVAKRAIALGLECGWCGGKLRLPGAGESDSA